MWRPQFSALRDASVVVVTEFTGSIEAGPSFIISSEGRLRRCLGTSSGVLKKTGAWPTRINAGERPRKAPVRICARVRVYVRERPQGGHGTTGPTAFYGFLTDHISRRPTTQAGASFVLSNKVANLHACTHARELSLSFSLNLTLSRSTATI